MRGRKLSRALLSWRCWWRELCAARRRLEACEEAVEGRCTHGLLRRGWRAWRLVELRERRLRSALNGWYSRMAQLLDTRQRERGLARRSDRHVGRIRTLRSMRRWRARAEVRSRIDVALHFALGKSVHAAWSRWAIESARGRRAFRLMWGIRGRDLTASLIRWAQ